MAKAQEIFYVTVGAKRVCAREGEGCLQAGRQEGDEEDDKDFVKRGKTLSTKVKNSGSTKKAIAQMKTARAQVKAVATSVTKAVPSLDEKATRSAATKTAKAP